MGLFGEGLYLAHELSVSMTFSSAGIGWEKAKCGDYLNCVLLCEFLEDPSYVKVRKAGKPIEKYDKIFRNYNFFPHF